MSDETPKVEKTTKKRKPASEPPAAIRAKADAANVVKRPTEDEVAPAAEREGQGIAEEFQHLRTRAHDSFAHGREFVLTWDRGFKTALAPARPCRHGIK
jgi:hypothetical protein